MASSLNLILAFIMLAASCCPLISSEALLSENPTHLHLYLHEISTGPNSTIAAAVVPPNPSPFGFGSMEVNNNMLREGPEPDSKLVGRFQGLLAAVSQHEISYLVAVNFVFTDGEYNGSTLAVFGTAVLASDLREWSIVGGTGRFRLARGYVIGKKRAPPAGIDLLIELDIYATKGQLNYSV